MKARACMCVVYDSQFYLHVGYESEGGGEKMSSVNSKEPNPYLCNEKEGSKKITKNSEVVFLRQCDNFNAVLFRTSEKRPTSYFFDGHDWIQTQNIPSTSFENSTSLPLVGLVCVWKCHRHTIYHSYHCQVLNTNILNTLSL